MRKRKNHPVKLILMLALLLVLLVALFVLIRAVLTPDGTADAQPRATQEPIYTPGPTLIDLYAYYDWTETTDSIRVYDHRADKLITMSLEEYSSESPAISLSALCRQDSGFRQKRSFMSETI